MYICIIYKYVCVYYIICVYLWPFPVAFPSCHFWSRVLMTSIIAMEKAS